MSQWLQGKESFYSVGLSPHRKQPESYQQNKHIKVVLTWIDKLLQYACANMHVP